MFRESHSDGNSVFGNLAGGKSTPQIPNMTTRSSIKISFSKYVSMNSKLNPRFGKLYGGTSAQ